MRLALADSLVGAGLGASSAADAGVGVNHIDVAFADSARGANRHTGAASNTIIVNYVSHCSK